MNTEISSRNEADREGGSGAYFPLRYITGLFDYVKQNPDRFEMITYADLAWVDGEPDFGTFSKEYSNWTKRLKSGQLNKKKIFLLVQYDVDSRPERTMNLLDNPSHQNIPANVMIFNKRIDRKLLKTTGVVEYTDYELDEALLRRKQSEGTVVGYHSNANERGGFDLSAAMEAFDEDASALVEKYGIRFFTAHGGVAAPDARNNRDLPFPQKWSGCLRWVHNGSSPRFDGVFSDGGHNNKKRDPAKRDMRDFVANFKPGRRYRMLLHPQYYDVNPKRSPRYSGTKWYDKMMDSFEQSSDFDPWRDFPEV